MSPRTCILAFVAVSVVSFSPRSLPGQDCPSCVTLASQGASPDTVSVAAVAYRAAFTLANRGADSATYYVAGGRGCGGAVLRQLARFAWRQVSGSPGRSIIARGAPAVGWSWCE